MAFWNRKKKRQKEQEEFELLEKEARKKLDALREQKKQEKRERENAKEERDPNLYETELVKPVHKGDQKRYVKECCQSIKEIDDQIEGIREEYQDVTDSLLDIQKIERIGGEDRKVLLEAAKSIIRLTKERNQYKNRNLSISDAMIRRFEPYEDDLVDEIKKMYDAENYQKLIDGDIEKLHQEKQMIRRDKMEIIEKQTSLKSMAKILIVLIISLFVLFVI